MIYLVTAVYDDKDNRQYYALYDSTTNKRTRWEPFPNFNITTTPEASGHSSIEDFISYAKSYNPDCEFSYTSAKDLQSLINQFPELFL